MTDTTPGLPRLGLTLFSLTLEQRRPGGGLTSLIREAAARGLGPGLEMVAFQSLRGWPRPGDDVVRAFRAAVDGTGFELSCLAINLDLALRPGRLLSDDEAYEYLAVQLRGAATLGFPVVRVGAECGPAVLARLLPLAAELRIRVGVEIHSPLTIDAPPVAALKEFFVATDSEWLGFIPDFSASMHAIPSAVVDAHRAAGIPPELTEAGIAIWETPGPPMAKFGRLDALDGRPDQIGNLKMLLTMHGRMEPARWAEFFPHVVHVHGKFYGVEGGEDPSIDYPAVLGVLREQGYTGFISSEYEAHAYTAAHNAFDQVAAHQQMCRRILEGATR